MISKELLSEIFMYKVTQIHNIDAENNIHFNGGNEARYPYFLIKPITINIHELAHKCKEWSFDNGYSLESAKKAVLGEENKMTSTWICCGFTPTYEVLPNFTANTEPEAIFKACEWVLKESK